MWEGSPGAGGPLGRGRDQFPWTRAVHPEASKEEGRQEAEALGRGIKKVRRRFVLGQEGCEVLKAGSASWLWRLPGRVGWGRSCSLLQGPGPVTTRFQEDF